MEIFVIIQNTREFINFSRWESEMNRVFRKVKKITAESYLATPFCNRKGFGVKFQQLLGKTRGNFNLVKFRSSFITQQSISGKYLVIQTGLAGSTAFKSIETYQRTLWCSRRNQVDICNDNRSESPDTWVRCRRARCSPAELEDRF